jgi:hypothetical protein
VKTIRKLIIAGLMIAVGAPLTDASSSSYGPFVGYRTMGPDSRHSLSGFGSSGTEPEKFEEYVLESGAKYIIGAFAAMGIEAGSATSTALAALKTALKTTDIHNLDTSGGNTALKLIDLGGYFYDGLKQFLGVLDLHEFEMGGYQPYDFSQEALVNDAGLRTRITADFVNLVVQGKANAISTAVYMALFEAQDPVETLVASTPNGSLKDLNTVLPLANPMPPTNLAPLLKDYRIEFELLIRALSYVISDFVPKNQQDLRPLASELMDYVVTELINFSDTKVLGSEENKRHIPNKTTQTYTKMFYEPFNEFLTALGNGCATSNAFAVIVQAAIIDVFKRFGHKYDGASGNKDWGDTFSSYGAIYDTWICPKILKKIDGDDFTSNSNNSPNLSGLRKFIPLTVDKTTYEKKKT